VRRVIVESPFAGKGDTKEERRLDYERKKRYLAACLHDCFMRDETPYASHAIGPLGLDDEIPLEREKGIQAGFAWREVAEATVVYTDLGTSTGMKYGIKHATELGHPVEYRELGSDWETLVKEMAHEHG
jgi:hypothetical protein